MFRHPLLSLYYLWLASAVTHVAAQKAGSFADGGNTQVSAMMVRCLFSLDFATIPDARLEMFVGNEEKVYMLDKAENNPAQIKGHPAWGSVW